MKRQIFVFFSITFAFYVHSSNLKFHSINETFGISMFNVSSVCKDGNGFIWASSRSGVIRLTDDSYHIYHLPFEKHNAVLVKLVRHNSELLAYANNGQIFRYNAIFDRFDRLLTIREFNIGIANIVADNKGTYWIGTNAGLYKYSKGSLKAQISHVDFRYITWYNDSQLIVATNHRISILDVRTLRSKTIYEYPSNQSFDVTKLFYDKMHRRLWIGTMSDGLYYYNFKTSSFTRSAIKSFPRQPILAIEANSDSTMLIGIDGHGVWKLDNMHDKLLEVHMENMDDPFSLPGNGVYDIYCDKQNGRVWVSTFSGGISFFEQTPLPIIYKMHQVNNDNSLYNNCVNKIIKDSKNNLWLATNNGVSYWDVHTDKWRTYYKNKSNQAQVFLSLCEDNEGRIWCGTYSSGIYVIDRQSGKEIAHYTASNTNAITDFVFDIYKDSQGDIWIGGGRGDVTCYLSKEKKFRAYSLSNIYTTTEFSPGKMLFGCASGLIVLDKHTGRTEMFTASSPCQDMILYKGYAWLCSSGDGLMRFDLKKKIYEKIPIQSGLLSNFVSSIMEAEDYLWVGTENGLSRFNPKTLTTANISALNILSNVSFNRGAHCKLSNGDLVWGTNRGLVIINPDLLKAKPLHGKIFIQDILVSGSSIRDNHIFKLKTPLDKLQKITLAYNQNNLIMQLLPLAEVSTKSKFSWIMEGVDIAPSSPTDYRTLNYSNIPVGEFVLKIKMYDNSLSQLVAERSFIIRVTPPFWGTWWFRLLLSAIVSGLFYFFMRFYINRLKQRHAEDKMRFFTNVAHEIRTTITLIKSPLEELNRIKFPVKEKHYLDLATEQARRLSTIVTQLLDFQKVDIGKGQLSLKMIDIVALIQYRRLMFEVYAKNKNIELIFTATEIYRTAVDQSKMEHVIDNLISNAIKYSHPDRQVQILFDGNEASWMLEVKDYGIGISSKVQRKLFQEFYRGENAINSNIVGSGIGLLLAKNYVSLHGGTIHCTSRENEGSSFKINIPFKEIFESDVQQQNEIMALPTSCNTELPNESSKKKLRLLIVEDNNDLQNFMSYALCEEFNVSVAKDGQIAWEMIKKQMPDIVVSDVMMPNMDGFELCRLIKSTYETSHIPVVLLTALVGKAEQLHGLGLGADSYLTKPFDMTLVTQYIRSIIQNRKIVRDKALKLISEGSDEVLYTNELNDKFIKKATEVVWANITNSEFSKEKFASAMNVSPSLLYKKIKFLTDKSPNEFANMIKLNYALELLKEHSHSVTEISELCGFSSLDYFGKAFKKHFGKSPSEINSD